MSALTSLTSIASRIIVSMIEAFPVQKNLVPWEYIVFFPPENSNAFGVPNRKIAGFYLFKVFKK